jgi:uncharacterized membrane protein
MKILKLAFNREIAAPMFALTFASGVSVALVLARIYWTGKWHYGFLVWNLFLAWLPLLFALLAREQYQNTSGRNGNFVGLTAAWLLFFPNSPYIFTDVIHLTTRYYSHFWVDLVLVLSCALTGLVVGFLSLFLMQSIVRRIWGAFASWLFIASVTGLSSFGIYMGRFLRFNSWDVIFKPVTVYHGIGHWAANPLGNSTSFAFPILFAAFLFIAYVMLYGLTHLQPTAFAAQGGRTVTQPA